MTGALVHENCVIRLWGPQLELVLLPSDHLRQCLGKCDCHNQEVILPGYSGQRPDVLLNFLHYTQQPPQHQRTAQPKTSTVLRLKTPDTMDENLFVVGVQASNYS